MKISRVTVSGVDLPLVKPYVVSYGTIYCAHTVVVQIETDADVTGYGEADPLLPFTSESSSSIIHTIKSVLAPAILGKDPRNIKPILMYLDSVVPGNSMAKGAIDMALHDILGKALSVPVYQLLGGAYHEEFGLLWPLSDQVPSSDTLDITAKMNEGYDTFMLKMGSLDDIDVEIERVKNINAQKWGKKIHVCVDANQGWSVEDTLKFVDGIKGLELNFIEQPIPVTQDWAFERIAARGAHSISADESLQSITDAYRLAASHNVGVFSIKVSKGGGIAKSKRMAEIADDHGIRCLFNSMLEGGITQAASLHLAAATPNLVTGGHCFMSTLRLQDDVTNFKSFVKNARVTVPNTPGLGIAVDQQKLAALKTEQHMVA